MTWGACPSSHYGRQRARGKGLLSVRSKRREGRLLKIRHKEAKCYFFSFASWKKIQRGRRKASKYIVRYTTTTLPRGVHSDPTTKWVGNLWEGNWALWTEFATCVQVSKGIPISEAVLGGEQFRRHEVGRVWNAHLWQEGKGVRKMKGRYKWGRKNGKGASKGRGDRILQSV